MSCLMALVLAKKEIRVPLRHSGKKCGCDSDVNHQHKEQPMKSKTGEVTVGMLVMIGLAVVAMIIGYSMYSKHSRRLAYEEQMRMEAARIEREKAEAERKKAEEEERELLRKRKERERAEAEREAKRLAEEKERKRAAEESRRIIAEREAKRKAYLLAKQSFSGMEAKGMIDLPSEQRPDFVAKGCDGWCVFPSFDEDGKVFCLTNDAVKGSWVFAHDGQSEPGEIDKDAFAKRFCREKSVTWTKDGVWVANAPKNGAMYAIPEEGMKFVPAAAELSEFYGVLKGLEVTFNDIRCRLTLRTKDGKRSIPIGVIGYEDSVGREKIEKLIVDQLAKGKQQTADRFSAKGPKLKKFRPNVVFYDGEIIKKGMNVTYVPRSFVYHGTTRYHDNHSHVEDIRRRARAEWERLSAEAKRQEAKAAEIEMQNNEMKARHDQRVKEAKGRLARVDDDEIENELSNWVIQVERGRSKQKK